MSTIKHISMLLPWSPYFGDQNKLSPQLKVNTNYNLNNNKVQTLFHKLPPTNLDYYPCSNLFLSHKQFASCLPHHRAWADLEPEIGLTPFRAKLDLKTMIPSSGQPWPQHGLVQTWTWQTRPRPWDPTNLTQGWSLPQP